MLADEIMIGNSVPFDELLKACAEIESMANHYVADETGHNQQSDSQRCSASTILAGARQLTWPVDAR